MSPVVEECTVRSADGTQISFQKSGTGPAVVIVHGSTDSHEGWMPVALALADRFTCYVLDRRGRGSSGDRPAYALARECEDIAAVLDGSGGEAHLLAHSFGAICALEVARQHPVARLAIYEPPLLLPPEVLEPMVRDVAGAMDRGDFDEGLSRFLLRGPALSEDEVLLLRTTPIWERMIEAAPTLLRELVAIQQLPGDVERFREVTAPTLLLVGSESRTELRDASSALERTLPDARTLVLEGQAHVANMLAPEAVAARVAEFLAPPR
jgi:pimeloyl-ACP methyl ester carboxylesterase